MKTTLNWGILGTGNIAKVFADALGNSQTGTLRAVGSRQSKSAQKFADAYSDVSTHGSYDELLANPNVDAVYISLPNHLHCEWTVRAAQAGKHILCEKPLAANFAEAMTMLEAARRHKVFFMEAFMYRCHPQTTKLVQLIRDGAIGEVRQIQANFSYNMGEALDNIRQQNESAGGGIMDVGCYCMSMARLVAGAANDKDFAEPLEIKAIAHIGEKSRVDEWATATIKFPGEILASLVCGTRVNVDSTLRVWGNKGDIQISNPWFPGQGDKAGEILIRRNGKDREKVLLSSEVPLYSLEADVVAKNVKYGQAPAPCMTIADSLGQQQALDHWRQEVGLIFDREKPEKLRTPFSGQKLTSHPEFPMLFGKVQGVEKPVSRVVMGSMMLSPRQMAYSFALLDDYFERGGNCIDTAWLYSGGQCEQAVGAWMKARGIRDEIVLIAKGAHTPECFPEGITDQLMESLDRLQTGGVDIYMMHRDNLEIPVAEFVECLNEHQKAGRMKSFGASNWSLQRLQEANEYAVSKSLMGFSSTSINFSLAKWNEPMWEGCVAGSDEKSKAWYRQTQMPLFAWSSQASGFFTGRFAAQSREEAMQNPDISQIARTWFNDANFARLDRARQLAEQKNTGATQIALAYVLQQPLHIFALIGPRTIEETRTSMLTLDVQLTPAELQWLDMGNNR